MTESIVAAALSKPCADWHVAERNAIAEWLITDRLDSLVRFAYGPVREMNTAEDIVQESILAALGCTYDPRKYPGAKCAFTNYLFVIIARAAAKSSRRRLREVRIVDEAVLEESYRGAPSNEFGIAEIRQHMGRLKDTYREALEMRYFQGLSLKAAAERSDPPCAVGNMKVRLFRAKQELRRLIGSSLGS